MEGKRERIRFFLFQDAEKIGPKFSAEIHEVNLRRHETGFEQLDSKYFH